MISKQEILNASILIVDDQQSNVFLLKEMLHDGGYTCIASTTDPYAVCELHRQNRYDLILLDLLMPGMDGFEVMKGLKKIETDAYLSVLVVTAQPNHKLKALAAGAKDFLTKPFNLLEVLTRIHNMLEVRLLYKQLEQHNKLLEQKVLERTVELQASEERFRRLTELSSDWYWEQDEKGAFTQVYGPVLEMLGLSSDALDKTGNESGTQWNQAEREILEANLAARRPFLDYVYSRVNSDGSQQYFMVSGEPMFNLSGRFTGYRGIGKDVTETMLAKNELPAKM
jgi:PAS domain S-box-containing protein